MPLTAAIAHPRLLGELRNMQRQYCSIFTLSSPPEVDSVGEVQQSWPDDYVVLTGHDALRCTLAVDKDATEQRQPDSTYVAQQLLCLLDGRYPLITERMKARVDGVDYDIKGVSQQSTLAVTRLALERIV